MIEKLGLNQALRYFFSGTILLLSAGYSYGFSWREDQLKKVSDTIGLAAALALTAGAVVYVLYRALLYNLLSRLSYWIAEKVDVWPDRRMKWLPFCIPENEYVTDCWRWRLSDPKGLGAIPAHGSIAEWGSHIHMCYSSVLSIWVGSLIGACIEGSCRFDPVLFSIATTVFVAGFVSHIRLKHMELRLKRETNRSKVQQPAAVHGVEDVAAEQ
jgi:hypothetical protein